LIYTLLGNVFDVYDSSGRRSSSCPKRILAGTRSSVSSRCSDPRADYPVGLPARVCNEGVDVGDEPVTIDLLNPQLRCLVLFNLSENGRDA